MKHSFSYLMLKAALVLCVPALQGYTILFHAGVVVAPSAESSDKVCAATLTSFTKGLVCNAGLPILSSQSDGRQYLVFSQCADEVTKQEAQQERLLIAQKIFELSTAKKEQPSAKEKPAPVVSTIASDKKNPEALLEIKIIALQLKETIAPETILKEGIVAFEQPFSLPGKTEQCIVLVKRSPLLADETPFGKAVKAVVATIDTGLIPNSQALLASRCKKYEA